MGGAEPGAEPIRVAIPKAVAPRERLGLVVTRGVPAGTRQPHLQASSRTKARLGLTTPGGVFLWEAEGKTVLRRGVV